MKFVYQDLLNFLSEKPSRELLSKKLFQLGHEHEINGDIFNMEITPNRGDCLSLIGLARDLNIFFGKKDLINFYSGDIDHLEIKFKNNSPFDCPKISFLEIEIDNYTTKEYKPYLENYFLHLGGNKTNLFTDVSNYISYELGQPTHCYDSKKLEYDLIFDNKLCNSPFKTVIGPEINLKDKNCVFSVRDEIINLAGLMGGASTACSSNTKKVLIECAYFNPESIIGKAVKYNLSSDASYKFERGVDRDCHDKVLRRFIKIISEHACIKTVKMRSFEFQDFKDKHLSINIEKINNILGSNIEETQYFNILNKLELIVQNNKISIPSHRHDINSQNDLAEEVARVIGYNNIKSSPISLPKPKQIKVLDKAKYLEHYLTSNGFIQVINFPFSKTKGKSVITVDNPLDSNKQYLREDLKGSLVKNFIYNQRRQKESIKLFEISDVYIKNPKISHKKKIGVIIGGRQGLNFKLFSKKLSIKYLEILFNGNLSSEFFNINEISPHELDTKKKDRVFYVEAFIDDIPDNFFKNIEIQDKPINFIKYKQISEFPSSSRDLSFSIKNPKSFSKLTHMLENINDEIISNSFIFDFYKNEKQEIIKLGVRIIFQSHSNTLSEENINKKLFKLLEPILKIDGVFIEGM